MPASAGSAASTSGVVTRPRVDETVFIDLDAPMASAPRSLLANAAPGDALPQENALPPLHAVSSVAASSVRTGAVPGGRQDGPPYQKGEILGGSPVSAASSRRRTMKDVAGGEGAGPGRGRERPPFSPGGARPPRTCAVVAPDVITYSSLITACERVGDARLALQLFRDMQERGIPPDVVVYSALVSACNKGECWQECLMVLRQMVAHGVPPNEYTYTACIDALGRAGQLDTAFAVYEEMRARGIAPTVVTYTTLASGAGIAGDFEASLRLLGDMARAGVDPDERMFTAVIRACGMCGQVAHAERVFLQMQRAYDDGALGGPGGQGGGTPGIDVYNAMILAYTRALMWQPAVTMHDVLRVAGLRQNVQGYTMLMYVCGAGGQQWRRSLGYFLDMLYDRLVPDIMACATLIDACTASNRPDVAQRVNALLEEARLLETGWDVAARHEVAARVGRGEACIDDGCVAFPTELNEVQRGKLQQLMAALEAITQGPDVLKPSELVST